MTEARIDSYVERYGRAMTDAERSPSAADDKAERRAARVLIAAYHQEQLRLLLEHVRAGFMQLDAGTIDEFDLDELIHRYKRAAQELWKFCGSSGGQWLQAAKMLAYARDRGDEPDWWEQSARRRNRDAD